MKKLKRKLLILGSLFLLLLTLSKTVSGQPASKTPSRGNKVARIIWNEEKGVFLTEKQEEYTIDQFLALEEYKGSYVAQYEINLHLQERLEEKNNLLKSYSIRLDNCETKIVNSVDNMEHYRKLYDDEKADNTRLKAQVKRLKVQLPLYKVGTVAFSFGTLLFGTMYLLNK